MKSILFICGSLEQGKDGVGDYTRSLAHELAGRGVQVRIISLVDEYVNQIQENVWLSPEAGSEVKSLRIPRNTLWNEKVDIVRSELLNFIPDLISFQIVPFAYNPRGILFHVFPYFIKMGKGFKIQIMFHELWIGNQHGASIKEKVLGFLQKKYILKMIIGLNPVIIHTTSDLSIFLLKKNNINASKLPVFSNIRKVDKNQAKSDELFAGTNVNWNQSDRKNTRIFTFFGAIHSEWHPGKLMTELKRLGQLTGMQIVISSIGRTDVNVWNNLKKKYENDFVFIYLGERTPEEVSTFLQEVDFGISSYPDILVEKSGTIAAFRQHGLPVVLSRDELVIPGFSVESKSQPLLYKVEELDYQMSNKPEIGKEVFLIFDLRHGTNVFLEEIDGLI
jgi:hypothetical protein